MTYSVSGKAAYITAMAYWLTLVKAATDANPANDRGLGLVYYDGQGGCYKMRDLTGDSATYSTAMAQSFRAPYRDYWLIGQGGGQGYRMFPWGLAEDWIRDNSQTTSKTAAGNTAVVPGSGGYNPWSATSSFNIAHLPDIYYSRETAYTLMCMLESARLGNSINTAWRDVLKGYCLGHITMWLTTRVAGLTSFYLRPFMVTLTFKALIQYHEQVSALTAAQIASMVALAEFIWSTMWNTGPAAGSNSFQYTDRATTAAAMAGGPNTDEQAQLTNGTFGSTVYGPGDGTGGQEASQDLNILCVLMFAWCWKQTGDQKWRDRVDAIFSNGVPVYTSLDATYHGGGFWVSGAYLGAQTIAGVDGKHCFQQTYTAYNAIGYAEGDPVTTPPANPPGTTGQTYYGIMGIGVYGGGAALKYNVTGSVTYNGLGLAGVTITSVALGNTTTDANGNYSLPNITPGTAYTITPTKTSYTFSPSSSSGTLNANATVSFTASLSTTFDPQIYYTAPTKAFYAYINDTAKVLDASGSVALNNINVKTVNDEWGGSVAMVQSTVANQPVCKTGIANSKQAIEFTGSPQTGSLTNATSILNAKGKFSIFAVFKLIGTGSNAALFRCFDHSFSFNRLRCYLQAGNPSMEIATADGTATTIINCTSWGASVTTLTTAAVHAVLWEMNGTSIQMTVDSYTASQTSFTGPGAAFANTTLNQPEIGLTANLDILALSIITDANCGQITNMFADAKTAWGITAY